MRQTLNRTMPVDIGGAVSQSRQAGKPLGAAGGLALTIALVTSGVAIAHIITGLLYQGQLSQAQQALAAANDRAAAANIAADKARATLAVQKAQIKAFCTATGGAPNGK